MTDLVVVSLEPWDDVWRRNQHLVSRLIAADPHLRVLFVEPADDPLHDLRRGRRPGFGRPVAHADERLYTFRPRKWLPRAIDRRADARIVQSIVRAVGELDMAEPTLWLNDPGLAVLSVATGWPTVYDITDDWAQADRASAERARIIEGELILLRTAAEVIGCSPEILRRKQPLRPESLQPLSLVPNAIDVAAFDAPSPRPLDMPRGRIALYLGTLHPDRLDVDLCVRTAVTLGDTANLVLVGPNHLGAADTGLLTGAGVRLLGSRPHESVVSYLRHADVLVVPHVVSAFTDSLDPIKLYEYRAAGKPIVSTRVAGFTDNGGPNTLAVGPDRFPEAVRRAAIERGRSNPLPDLTLPDWGERAREAAVILNRARRS